MRSLRRDKAVKRCLTKLVVFLLLGAVLNVAVAWGCAVLVDISIPEDNVGLTDLNGPQWLFGSRDRLGMTQLFMRPRWYDQYHDPRALFAGSVPYWSKASERPDPRDRDQRFAPKNFLRYETAGGWPARSMMWFTETTDTAWVGGVDRRAPQWCIELSPDTSRSRASLQRRGLPLLPIWPGFVINTLLGATVLWLAMLAPITLRRHIRRKRGNCIKCGYDLRRDLSRGCPECGWRREAEA